MPSWVPKIKGNINLTDEAGTAMATSVANNVKGPWAQVFASTKAETNLIAIGGRFQNPEGDFLMDVGIGGVGSEQIIIEDVPCGFNNDFDNLFKVIMPIRIQKGERVVTRHQSTGADNVSFGLSLFEGSPWPAGQYAKMLGQDHDNSKLHRTNAGSGYVEIGSGGLAHDYKYLIPVLTGRGANFSVADHSTSIWAHGDAGNEVDFYQVRHKIENLQDRISGHCGFLVNTFPKGTRITAVFSDATINVGMGLWGIV